MIRGDAPCVCDASVVLAVLLPDERWGAEQALKKLAVAGRLVAPAVWRAAPGRVTRVRVNVQAEPLRSDRLRRENHQRDAWMSTRTRATGSYAFA